MSSRASKRASPCTWSNRSTQTNSERQSCNSQIGQPQTDRRARQVGDVCHEADRDNPITMTTYTIINYDVNLIIYIVKSLLPTLDGLNEINPDRLADALAVAHGRGDKVRLQIGSEVQLIGPIQ